MSPDYVNYARHNPVHRAAFKDFLKTEKSKSGCTGFYSAVKIHGWQAFELAVLAFPSSTSNVRTFENAWLALEPLLNGMFVSNGYLRHSPASIINIKAGLGSGPSHHSYGVARTPAQNNVSMLASVNREPVYQYSYDYAYTDVKLESITQAWRVTKIHIDQFVAYINTSVLLGEFRYSSVEPQ
ncbi:hypothetical protein HK100_004317, partial [Physocladia obscura]